MNRQRIISYAQNREDMILTGFFEDKKIGFYVDIGANHPSLDSVTKHFYDKGWTGINVEPTKRLHGLIEEARPHDTNLQLGIADKPGKLILREYEGWYSGLSTFSEEMKQENEDTGKFREIEVEVITLEKLFSDNNVKTIDFMKIDVEGFEYNVLKGNDWDKYRPKIICVEANHLKQDWRPILTAAKYTKVFFDGLNEYYVAEENKKIADDFSYVNSIIGKPLISAELNQQFIELEQKLSRYKADYEFYKTENNRLSVELAESKMILPLIKQLAKTIDAGIRRRISSLNNRKNNKELQPFELPNDTVKDKLLKTIKSYDLNNYYSDKVQKDRLIYRFINNAYNAFSIILFRAGKSTVRFIRSSKK